ncbi:MAG: hypothetical protein L6437_08220, partial [Kiritimatiellae bacterium]|nr:hypothetical protein [Kiritimatiellia bacterium]
EIEVETEKTGLGTPAVDAYEGWVDPMSGQNWGATHYRRQNATPGWSATLRLKLSGQVFRALFPVVSTNDGTSTLAAAKECVNRALKFSLEDLETNSRQATPAERVGTYQYQQDLALSSIFSAKFCYSDHTAWHGDYHFNEFYFDFVRRDPVELETFFQMVETNLPAARALAKEAFKCRGAAWGVASFPRKFERLPTTNLDWDYSIECTGLVFQPFWHAYLYTMDREFLKRRAYPAIKEAALFYTDYVTLEKDGLYHIGPCVSSEHMRLQPYLRYNRDSQGALGACRYILNAAIEAVRGLNVDHELSRSWQNIVDQLAPYPVEETPEGPRFVDVAGARLMTEYNIFQPLSAVFFWDDIGLASPAEQIIVAKRTLKGLVRLGTTHWGHVYRAMIRLGMWPGDVIKGTCEHLIQSHQGPIFLFPAVPDGYTDEFEDLRARGAFRVSAAIAKGRLTRVKIKSLAGETCRVDVSRFKRMPAVRCLETGSYVETATDADRFLVFATIPGETYALQLR